MQLWVCKWYLAVFIVVLPLLLFPLVLTGLFQVLPIGESLLVGLFGSLFAVTGLRVIQVAKVWGLKSMVLLIALIVIITLLLIFLDSYFSNNS